MRVLVSKFFINESGATLVEYGVALLVAIIVGGTALSLLADDVDASMDLACDSMRPATATGVTWSEATNCN